LLARLVVCIEFYQTGPRRIAKDGDVTVGINVRVRGHETLRFRRQDSRRGSRPQPIPFLGDGNRHDFVL